MQSRSPRALSAALLVVVVGLGCKSEKKGDGASSASGASSSSSSAASSADGALAGTGTALYSGIASDLRLSADGKRAAFLLDARKPRIDGIPPQVMIGELHCANTDGGDHKVGQGITNVPGGYLFSPDSHWLMFLQGFNPAEHEGELMLVDATRADSTPRSLASGVTYFVASPDSKWVAFVEAGALRVAPLAAEGNATDVSADVTNAEFAPNGQFLVLKRSLSAGGGIALAKAGAWDKLVKLGDQVGDYAVSKDAAYVAFSQRSTAMPGTYELFHAVVSSGKTKKVADGVTTGAPYEGPTFTFSPDGKFLARIEGGRPDKRGSLVIGGADGGAGTKIADNVFKFEFAADSTAVAYLDKYSDNRGPGAGHGNMGVAVAPAWKAKQLGERVPNFEWGSDGKELAFVSRFFKPVYSVDLMLYRVGEDAPKKVQEGVFGYEFSAQNKYLLMRTHCIRDGRACELHALDITQADATPKKVMDGVYSFRTAPKDPERVLATYARTDNTLYDAMAFNLKTQQFKTLDRGIQLPALFAAPDGSKVAYVIADRPRAGVYVSNAVP